MIERYIAVELAGIYNALGAETHICTRGDHALRQFDEIIWSNLKEEMAKRGPKVHTVRTPNKREQKPSNQKSEGVSSFLKHLRVLCLLFRSKNGYMQALRLYKGFIFLMDISRFLSISLKIAVGFMKIAAWGGGFHESQRDFDGNRQNST